MPLMGYREYARHRGCGLYSVQKAIEAGRIKTVEIEGKPKIDSEQADRDWIRNTDPAKQSMLKPEQPALPGLAPDTPPAPHAPPETQSGAEGTDDPESAHEQEASAEADTDPGFREARTARERLRLEREQLEFDKLRGETLHVEDAARIAGTALRTLRDSLGNISPRISAQLAALDDPVKIEALLQSEIDIALRSVTVEALLTDAPDDDEDA